MCVCVFPLFILSMENDWKTYLLIPFSVYRAFFSYQEIFLLLKIENVLKTKYFNLLLKKMLPKCIIWKLTQYPQARSNIILITFLARIYGNLFGIWTNTLILPLYKLLLHKVVLCVYVNMFLASFCNSICFFSWVLLCFCVCVCNFCLFVC